MIALLRRPYIPLKRNLIVILQAPALQLLSARLHRFADLAGHRDELVHAARPYSPKPWGLGV